MKPDDTSGKPSSKLGHYLLTALKICLVVGLFWYMIHKGLISPERLRSLFSIELLPAVVTAALMCLVSYMLVAVRQRILLKTISIHLSFLQSFYVIYVGVFLNNVFPGSTGGDVSRLYLLGKDNRDALSNIAGFTLFDKAMAFSAIAAFAVVAVGYTLLWESSRLQGEWSWLLWIVLVACLAPIFFFSAIFFGRIPFVRDIARRVFSLMPKSSWVIEFFLTLEGFSQRRGVIACSFVVSVLSCAAQLVAVAVLSQALFGSDGVYPALVTSPIVMLSGAIPVTPGNIGGAEYLASVLWNVFGVGGGGTVWASWRVVAVLMSLFGGILYLFKFKGVKRSTDSQAEFLKEPELVSKRPETP